ncbi:MAG: insulinase family protein [Alphaproteobacteria bacterium]|nr:insulinase family protein [Alphaproteobacteria bacterium]
MSSIKLTTLENGLRIATDPVPHVESAAVGVWVGVGTRDEDLRHNGVAHMVEHMLFKGTKNRNAQTIAEELENVGGQMNAYTGREVTSYHAHVLKNDVPLALDVLGDMILNSILPLDEIERERDVILQEIGMSVDTPDDLIFDEYYKVAYPNQALGAPILGTTEIIAGMTKATLQSYIDTFYTPSRMVICGAGNINHDEFVQQAEALFKHLPQDKPIPHLPASCEGGEIRISKKLEQIHFILGFQGLSLHNENYYSGQALSSLLGGGMSSRLFQEVREKRGLVYSIFSFKSAWQDDGQFGIYAGTGPEKMPEILPIVREEISKATHTLTDQEIDRAKMQMKSSVLMGRESMMRRVDKLARHLLHHNRPYDPAAEIIKIDAIEKKSVESVAAHIFGGKQTFVSLGPDLPSS